MKTLIVKKNLEIELHYCREIVYPVLQKERRGKKVLIFMIAELLQILSLDVINVMETNMVI